jgi:transcriptional regulator with XRE-family HTH domain
MAAAPTPDDKPLQLGEKLRRIRILKDYSQEYVAHKLGISQRAYGSIERDEADITVGRLKQITDVLGVDLSHVFGIQDHIANFFDNCQTTNVNAGTNSSPSQHNNYYDTRELMHQLETAKLEIKLT